MTSPLWRLRTLLYPFLWVPRTKYEGLLQRCSPGTHEAGESLLLKHLNRCNSVLDLGSGTGAWLARMKKHGFTGLNAVELDTENFSVPGVEPLPIDLNSAFSRHFDKSFQLVTAIEIIEHLDCPRHFLREIHRLLSGDGYLLLTCPNVGHWMGRMRFLLWGELRMFDALNYRSQRHISPITDAQIRQMFRETGFRLIGSTTAGNSHGCVLRIATSPARLLFRIAAGRQTDGDVAIYLARKSAPDSESRGRDSLYFRRSW